MTSPKLNGFSSNSTSTRPCRLFDVGGAKTLVIHRMTMLIHAEMQMRFRQNVMDASGNRGARRKLVKFTGTFSFTFGMTVPVVQGSGSRGQYTILARLHHIERHKAVIQTTSTSLYDRRTRLTAWKDSRGDVSGR